jgi:hypothetical protein
VGFSPTTSAEDGWCGHDDVSGGSYDKALCVSQVYDSLPTATQAALGGGDTGKAAFIKQAQNCMSGNSGGGIFGIDNNIHEGDCVNAAKTCLTQALDTASCTNNNMKTIADDCNEGKLESIKSNDCERLNSMNQAAISAAEDAAKSQATSGSGCTQTGTQTQKTEAVLKCGDDFEKVVSHSCDVVRLNNDGTPKDPNAYANYQKCLQNAVRTSAKDQSECTARGGNVYVAQEIKDPSGSNTVGTGCKTYQELDNTAACAAAKPPGVWSQEAGKTGNDGWGCHDPKGDQQQQQTPQEKGSAQCDLQYPVPDKTDKDYAKGNALNAACKSGANGHDCTEQTSSADVSTEDLQKACKVGAANAAGTIPDTLAKPNGTCTFGNTTVRTNLISCDKTANGGTAIGEILKIGVYVLSALIGILAVGGLAWGAIQYAQAGDNQGTVSEAKVIIRNVIIGIILYGFLIAIVNFLLPGGLFK